MGDTISIEEFSVNNPAEKMWIGGLIVYAGKEEKTMEEWKQLLEEFKTKPSDITQEEWHKKFNNKEE